MSNMPSILLSKLPAQLRTTTTKDHSSRHFQQEHHSNQWGNSSQHERGLLVQEQVKTKPCLMLKADKKLTAPPGIYHQLIPPANSHSIHSSCQHLMVCSTPPEASHNPHRKQGKRQPELTSRTKVHPEVCSIFSIEVWFLLAFCFSDASQN